MFPQLIFFPLQNSRQDFISIYKIQVGPCRRRSRDWECRGGSTIAHTTSMFLGFSSQLCFSLGGGGEATRSWHACVTCSSAHREPHPECTAATQTTQLKMPLHVDPTPCPPELWGTRNCCQHWISAPPGFDVLISGEGYMHQGL